MSVKTAAFMAAVGMILLSALTVFDLFQNLAAIIRGLVPAVILFRWLVYAFATITVAVYLFVAYKRQA
ncbi:MAG TPA: hypothetical protein VF146_09585 [Bryobacteraceae bacterium]